MGRNPEERRKRERKKENGGNPRKKKNLRVKSKLNPPLGGTTLSAIIQLNREEKRKKEGKKEKWGKLQNGKERMEGRRREDSLGVFGRKRTRKENRPLFLSNSPPNPFHFKSDLSRMTKGVVSSVRPSTISTGEGFFPFSF